jgi:hypothetical protein
LDITFTKPTFLLTSDDSSPGSIKPLHVVSNA